MIVFVCGYVLDLGRQFLEGIAKVFIDLGDDLVGGEIVSAEGARREGYRVKSLDGKKQGLVLLELVLDLLVEFHCCYFNKKDKVS